MPPNQPAYLLTRRFPRLFRQITRRMQRLQQRARDPLHVPRRRRLLLQPYPRHLALALLRGTHGRATRFTLAPRVPRRTFLLRHTPPSSESLQPRQLIHAHCHRLPQIHRPVLRPRRNPQQPVTMAHLLVRKPHPLRPKQQRHIPRGIPRRTPSSVPRRQPPPYQRSRFRQTLHSVMQLPRSHRRGPHHQRAVRNGLRKRRKLLRVRQHLRRPHRRPRLAIPRLIRRHHAHPQKSKITHGSRRRPNVQRIPRIHQYHPQPVKLFRNSHEAILPHAASAFVGVQHAGP